MDRICANWNSWLLWAFGLVLMVLLWGCSDQGMDMTHRDALDWLERGEARGHLTLSTGGSPLTAGMKQVFFLGPENTSMAFDGDIDYRNNGEPLAPPE